MSRRLAGAFLGLVVVGLLATAFLPFVNRSTLWLGLPSVMVWSVVLVLLLSVGLAWLEFGFPHEDDHEGEPLDWGVPAGAPMAPAARRARPTGTGEERS